MTNRRCSLCGSTAKLLSSDHQGYQKPDRYSIYECTLCDLQFAEPLRSRGEIYEIIYRNSSVLPGYARYHRYTDGVLERPDPLSWLAEQEDVYWFVRDVVLKRSLGPDDAIYEIGSGLGYLTFALRRSGIAVTGCDISETAVLAATKRFGPYYQAAPAGSIASLAPGTASVVVMTELIEHVEEPESLLGDVHRLLKPGGIALVTTPNKSIFPVGAYWKGENPPVHLWWFSETSMRGMAVRQNFDVAFFDFSQFNSFRVGRISPTSAINGKQHAPPHLDEHGMPLHRDTTSSPKLSERIRSRMRRFLCGIQGDARLAISRSSAEVALQRSDTMGAILTRRDD
jgi:SAM-dependent methyltransferase